MKLRLQKWPDILVCNMTVHAKTVTSVILIVVMAIEAVLINVT